MPAKKKHEARDVCLQVWELKPQELATVSLFTCNCKDSNYFDDKDKSADGWVSLEGKETHPSAAGRMKHEATATMSQSTPPVSTEWLAHLISIQEVPDSNLRLVTPILRFWMVFLSPSRQIPDSIEN
jgi:hypothetical protein